MKRLRRTAARILLVTYTAHRILGSPTTRANGDGKRSSPAECIKETRGTHAIPNGSLKTVLALATLLPLQLAAQSSPWANVANKLGPEFAGPIARGFSLVAIVIGGLQLAFSDGSGKRTIGGLVFGLGMALGAAQFMAWLFA